MKKIAIDLDGVVFDSETLFRVYSEIYDIDVLKSNNVVNNIERTFQKRYNWNENICHSFYDKYAMEILKNASIMPGADYVLNILKKSYEIIIVTARLDSEMEITNERLKEVGLERSKIYTNQKEKIDIFLKEEVNLVIDDDLDICRNAANIGIKAFYFKNSFSPIIKDNNLNTVTNWGEIYKYIVMEGNNDR